MAAVPLTTFDDWWKELPQATRKNVRRSERRGVAVRVSSLDQQLAQGIKSIYDETPIRQGRRFWHYGKDVERVLRENSTYSERSDFIAAFHQEELIGFIKLVYVGKTAQIMQILSKNQHFDKRPANALLAQAVEVCCRKGMSFFVYGKYIYGNKSDSELIEFKRRNGFKQIEYPRYYVPLSPLGRLAIKCGLHRGWRSWLPPRMESLLLDLRSKYYARRLPGEKSKPDLAELDQKEEAGSRSPLTHAAARAALPQGPAGVDSAKSSLAKK